MPPCDSLHSFDIIQSPFVSILVLVDAALRLHINVIRETVFIGFNPCFSGCRPATIIHTISHYPIHLVSILVLVDAALRLCDTTPVFEAGSLFQSLF